MWYVCDVLYVVLYVRVSYFVVRGFAVSRMYINVCKCDMLCTLGVFALGVSLVCDVMIYACVSRISSLSSSGLF